MFWKVKQLLIGVEPKDLKIVEGEFRTGPNEVIAVTPLNSNRSRFESRWNGREILIDYAGYGMVRVVRNVFNVISVSRFQYDDFTGIDTIEYPATRFDDLERLVRKSLLRNEFESCGISIESFSLEQLYIYGNGLAEGWRQAIKNSAITAPLDDGQGESNV